MNISKSKNLVTRLPRLAISLVLIAELTLSFLLSPQRAASLPEDEPIPEGTWGGYAGPQINAQKVLYETMLKVSSSIKQYCSKHRHCPEAGDEVEALTARLRELMPNNPYTPGGSEAIKVKLSFEESLNEPLLAQYQDKPPSHWTAPVGTISVVISNSNNLFVIWGAGMDGRPIRHPTTQHVTLVSRHCLE
ncbi:MAG: hypothetical protein HY711_01010 [Candidatus Melainabacteria bacterium]|nr:hypothetical protein [Candidatus Melainabacteria bacterium]